MMADPLTKRLRNANFKPLLQVMKSDHNTLGSELDEEEVRQPERQTGRVLQRMKCKPLSDETTSA